MKKWDELAVLVGDRTEMSELNISFGWGSRPTTVGSLALVYLNIELNKNPNEVGPHIDSIALELVELMRRNTKDFQENSMLLLNAYLSTAFEGSIEKLAKPGVFAALSVFLLSERPEMSYLASAVCAAIYRNRLSAQEEFLKAKGGSNLVQLLAWSTEKNDQVVERLLDNLIDLILEKEGSVVHWNASQINLERLQEALNQLATEKRSVNLLRKISALLQSIERLV